MNGTFQLGFRCESLGTGEGRFILETESLGRNVGSRRRDGGRASRANTVRAQVCHAHCSSEYSGVQFAVLGLFTARLGNMVFYVIVWVRITIVLQGGHIKIHLHSDIPVQVDGEPWVQSPCDVVVLKSALKVIFGVGTKHTNVVTLFESMLLIIMHVTMHKMHDRAFHCWTFPPLNVVHAVVHIHSLLIHLYRTRFKYHL